ncbi:MAG: VirB3 family type IV secretion system protein [Acidobacteria bacterium]|nr:VirB3 family type IV secretion system protein [Acidobacteriota bacterium]
MGSERLTGKNPFPALVRPPLLGGVELLGVAWILGLVGAGLVLGYVYIVDGEIQPLAVALVVLPVFPGVLLLQRRNRRDPQFLAIWLRSQRYARAYQPRAYVYAPKGAKARTL